MKKLLFLFPLMFIGAKFGSEQIKPAKEELNIIEISKNHPIEIPAICTQKNNNEDNEVSGYTHCRTCGYGVFLEHDGIQKCTYCGVKQNYESR